MLFRMGTQQGIGDEVIAANGQQRGILIENFLGMGGEWPLVSAQGGRKSKVQSP